MKNFFRKLHIGEGSRKGIGRHPVSEQRQQPSVLPSGLESAPTRSPAHAEAEGPASASPAGEERRQSGAGDRRRAEEEDMEKRQLQADQAERERQRSREEDAVEERVITESSESEDRKRETEKEQEELELEEFQLQLMLEMSARENPEEIEIQIAEQMSLNLCWPSSSTAEGQLRVGLLTLLIAGAALLLLAGITITGAVVALVFLGPLALLTSPIWVPFVLALCVVGFAALSAAGFAVACLAVGTWAYRYLTGRHPVGADQVDRARSRIADTASHVKDYAREYGGYLNSRVKDAAPGA